MSILPPSHIVQSYDNMDFLKKITLTYYINGGGSLVAKLCPILSCATAWTVAHQASLSMGFPRQKYWSGLPYPSPCLVQGKLQIKAVEESLGRFMEEFGK